MTLYRYIKKPVKRPLRRPVVVSFFSIGLGTGILAWAMWPIISFGLLTAPLLSTVISPIQDGAVLGAAPVVLANEGHASTSGQTSDFTNPNIWFPQQPQKKVVAVVNSYKLTIPKLEIRDATVTIAGDDLNKSLIHYGGTGLPGEYGNTVIFGHSVLPQFFNPKDYKTIFSTIPTLKVGDAIFLQYDGVTYKYLIDRMIVRDPADLTALEQKFDDSYLTLVTCVPPGTYWKRLNIHARIAQL